MTSVWFAASGSGEDGDEYDVHEVFSTQEAAQAHCDRPDKPAWEHRYVEEWPVTGSLLTDEEREAVQEAIRRLWGFDIAATLRGLLDRTK